MSMLVPKGLLNKMYVFFQRLPVVFNNESLYLKASIFSLPLWGAWKYSWLKSSPSYLTVKHFYLFFSHLLIAVVIIYNLFCNWNITSSIYKNCFETKNEVFSPHVSILCKMITSDPNYGQINAHSYANLQHAIFQKAIVMGC